MNIRKIQESGYDEALLGLSLSYNAPFENMAHAARKLADKDGGHNKFLESIMTWWDMTAPRYWWQQFDTYRVGVTKQSESTMHTLMKTELTQAHFEHGCSPSHLKHLNWLREEQEFDDLKNQLPEGFLQRRIVCMNYKVLRTIMTQRRTHTLQEWQQFVQEVVQHVDHPDLLPTPHV